MAENNEDRNTEDLSDEASPHRIEEMRRKGQVAQSRELTGLLALLAAAVTTYVMSPSLGKDIAAFMQEVFRTDLSARANLGDASIAGQYMWKALRLMILLCIPVSVAGFILGVAGSLMQIGGIFSWDPITPDLKKIDPISGFKRIFSVKSLIDGGRLILKAVAVIAVAYFVMRDQVLGSGAMIDAEAQTQFVWYARAASGIFGSMFGVLAVFSLIDFAIQRWEFGKNVRLTKQEAKQEHKEREGDPQIRARIRAVQREMARKRMMQAVKKADVIITNPTHIAIAIIYDKDKMAAPKVVAKGADFVAQKIKEIARGANVPLVENVPLARTLFKTAVRSNTIESAIAADKNKSSRNAGSGTIITARMAMIPAATARSEFRILRFWAAFSIIFT